MENLARIETRGTGKNKYDVAVVTFENKPMGLIWNVKEETEETTLADANFEVRKTSKGNQYARLTIKGVTYAQGLDNLLLAYAKSTESKLEEGKEFELPLDAIFKLTSDGAQFKKN